MKRARECLKINMKMEDNYRDPNSIKNKQSTISNSLFRTHTMKTRSPAPKALSIPFFKRFLKHYRSTHHTFFLTFPLPDSGLFGSAGLRAAGLVDELYEPDVGDAGCVLAQEMHVGV